MREALGFALGMGLATSYVLLLRLNARLYPQASGQGAALLVHVGRLVILVAVMVLLGSLGKRCLLYGLLGFMPTHLVLYLWLRRQPDDIAPP